MISRAIRRRINVGVHMETDKTAFPAGKSHGIKSYNVAYRNPFAGGLLGLELVR
jgi:hypothetical protein